MLQQICCHYKPQIGRYNTIFFNISLMLSLQYYQMPCAFFPISNAQRHPCIKCQKVNIPTFSLIAFCRLINKIQLDSYLFAMLPFLSFSPIIPLKTPFVPLFCPYFSNPLFHSKHYKSLLSPRNNGVIFSPTSRDTVFLFCPEMLSLLFSHLPFLTFLFYLCHKCVILCLQPDIIDYRFTLFYLTAYVHPPKVGCIFFFSLFFPCGFFKIP